MTPAATGEQPLNKCPDSKSALCGVLSERDETGPRGRVEAPEAPEETSFSWVEGGQGDFMKGLGPSEPSQDRTASGVLGELERSGGCIW